MEGWEIRWYYLTIKQVNEQIQNIHIRTAGVTSLKIDKPTVFLIIIILLQLYNSKILHIEL